MPLPSDHEQKLEAVIHRTLRALPPLRAPRTLEARVLAELSRRIALPWWRKSFAHWPLPARVAFLALCAAIVYFGVLRGGAFSSALNLTNVRLVFAEQFGWLDALFALKRVVGEFVQVMFRNLPPLWTYGAAGFLALMYLAFLGLGTAAYRTLYASR